MADMSKVTVDMSKSYHAMSPAEIITQFERKAADADARAAKSISKEHRVMLKSEEATWREAADILKITDFVGWSGNVGSGVPKIKPLDWTIVGIVARAVTPFGDFVVCDNFWKSPRGPILEVRTNEAALEAAEAHYMALVGGLLA